MELKPLNPAPYGFKREDLLECVDRELRMRNMVYPKRVEEKKMSKESAERELGMMEQIKDAVKLATYFDNADLCVAAIFIELRKYMCFEKLLDGFSYSEMEIIQQSITRHIRQNIYQVKEIEEELDFSEPEETIEEEDDIGL